MRRGTAIALVIGVAIAAAAVVYAGAGTVVHAIERLRISGLFLLVFLHLPIVVLMGCCWWLAAGEAPPASLTRFVWARFVRDAAAEVLPFLQVGGIVLGVRALGRGRTMVMGAVSASIDGLIELTAKLPYALVALLTLLALAPEPRLARPLSVALAATAVLVALLVCARRSLGTLLALAARALRARWPAVFAPDVGAAGCDIQECFELILGRRARLWSAFALHLCCWCLGAAEAWVTFRLLGVDLTMAQALAIDGTVVGLRTFGVMVPAAAGVQEASYLLAAAVFGIPPAMGIAASFARRARDLVLGVATLALAVGGGVNLRFPAAQRSGPRASARAAARGTVRGEASAEFE